MLKFHFNFPLYVPITGNSPPLTFLTNSQAERGGTPIISQNWDLFLILPQNGNSEIFPVRHSLPFVQKKKQKEPVFVFQNQQRGTFIKVNKNGNG